MKYKILICGKNMVLIKDFFLHTSNDFDCITTSSIWEDVTSHINIFRPDAYFCFCEQNDDGVLSQLKSIRSRVNSDLPFVIACESAAVDTYKKKTIGLNTLVISKSSPQIMAREIKNYISGVQALNPKPAEPPKTEAPAAPADDFGLGISLSDLKKSFDDMPRKKHILVVDDDRSILKMLKTALSDDYDVTTMVNGKLAIKFLESKTADLILLDYEMPEETGPDVFRKIKSLDSAKKIPVVFLTGVADSDKIKDVLALRPQGYLLKPIDMDRLRKTIKDTFK